MHNKPSNTIINGLKRKRYIRQQRRRRTLSLTLLSLTFICFLVNGLTSNADEIEKTIYPSNSPYLNKYIPTKVTNEPIPKTYELMDGSNVSIWGNKYAIDATIVEDMLNGTYAGTEKYVFLTFDDGPSYNTEAVLDVLRENDAKATFFVLGKNIAENDNSEYLLKRTLLEGHAIANHSYTHNLELLYPNNIIDADYFMHEFNKTNELIKSIVGNNFDTKVLRLPGGYSSRTYYNDPNLSIFDEFLIYNNIISLDWNALNGDAEGIDYSTNEMLEYAKNTTGTSNQVVVLMHDTYGKEKTAEMLPELIKFYKDNGYEFKTIK